MMDFKKIIMLSLILIVIISSLSVTSAGWFDFLESSDDSADDKKVSPLINGSVVITANHPETSDEYAYYYEDTGEYSNAAYYRNWEINSSFNFDVEKLYENQLDSADDYYKKETLDEYKNYLRQSIDDGNITIIDQGTYCDKNGTRIKTPFSTPDSTTGDNHYHNYEVYLSNNDTILTIKESTGNNGYRNYHNDVSDLDKVSYVQNVSFSGIPQITDKIPVTFNPVE